MQAIQYSKHGTSSVLQVVKSGIPSPGPGEVRVRVHVSGVNPTDWKSRSGSRPLQYSVVTPHHDGAGVVESIGTGVSRVSVGDRVWINMSQHESPYGTAQEYTVVSENKVAPLPDSVDFEVGACLGVPAITAHRALTVHENGPTGLQRNSLQGRVILVHGGAGAVGNSAIQLAVWAGATVITTVSSPYKAELARAAGAHHVFQYPDTELAEKILQLSPKGVDQIVEVSPAHNVELDVAVIANQGAIAVYGSDKGKMLNTAVSPFLSNNVRLQGVLLYTLEESAITAAADDISQALEDNAFRVGVDAGLPLTWFPLERTADAQDAVESGTVGKVLVDVSGDNH